MIMCVRLLGESSSCPSPLAVCGHDSGHLCVYDLRATTAEPLMESRLHKEPREIYHILLRSYQSTVRPKMKNAIRSDSPVFVYSLRCSGCVTSICLFFGAFRHCCVASGARPSRCGYHSRARCISFVFFGLLQHQCSASMLDLRATKACLARLTAVSTSSVSTPERSEMSLLRMPYRITVGNVSFQHTAEFCDDATINANYSPATHRFDHR